MHDEPKDVDGECNAHLYIADNSATIRCQLPIGHTDEHKEEFERCGTPVIIKWELNERVECNVCRYSKTRARPLVDNIPWAVDENYEHYCAVGHTHYYSNEYQGEWDYNCKSWRQTNDH